MIETSQQFSRAFHAVALTTDERAAMRRKLEAYMRATPPQTNPAWLAVGWMRRHVWVSGLATVVALGATTTALASTARPDDFLYPLRINVVDRVAVVLASNEDDRIDVGLSQVGRMISDEDAVSAKEVSDVEHSISDSPSQSQGSVEDHSDQSAEIDSELRNLNAEIEDVARQTPPQ